MAGFTATTPLVIDRRTAASSVGPRHGDAWETIDAATTLRLRTFAEAHGLTMNALVTGAWAILLYRYSGDEDVFGATRACRKSSAPHADRTIGLFINTVPVRVKLRGDDLLLSVFQAVRQQWLDVRPYEHTPLARVKNVSQLTASRPLFESLVVFERYRQPLHGPTLGTARR